MDALIAVDLQIDFLPGGALPVPEGNAVIALANRVQESFDVVVATQDWHPLDHCSFAANHPGKKPGQVIELNGLPQTLWPVHCVQNTPGAALAPELNVSRLRKVFPKGTDPEIDGYSGFFDNARRHATGLDDFLQEAGVTNVYLLGLATDYCVKFTALDARSLGFETIVIEDACRGVELKAGDVQAALDEMSRAGIHIICSGEIARRADGPVRQHDGE